MADSSSSPVPTSGHVSDVAALVGLRIIELIEKVSNRGAGDTPSRKSHWTFQRPRGVEATTRSAATPSMLRSLHRAPAGRDSKCRRFGVGAVAVSLCRIVSRSRRRSTLSARTVIDSRPRAVDSRITC